MSAWVRAADAMDSAMDSAMDNEMDDAIDNAMDNAMDSAMDSAMDNEMDDAMDNAMDNAMDDAMDDAMDSAGQGRLRATSGTEAKARTPRPPGRDAPGGGHAGCPPRTSGRTSTPRLAPSGSTRARGLGRAWALTTA